MTAAAPQPADERARALRDELRAALPNVEDRPPQMLARLDALTADLAQLRIERDEARAALQACASAAGTPDAAEGCRHVIAIAREFGGVT